jgi:hypothetical protein
MRDYRMNRFVHRCFGNRAAIILVSDYRSSAPGALTGRKQSPVYAAGRGHFSRY